MCGKFASSQKLPLQHPIKWLETHFVLLTNISCAVFQLNFHSVISK